MLISGSICAHTGAVIIVASAVNRILVRGVFGAFIVGLL